MSGLVRYDPAESKSSASLSIPLMEREAGVAVQSSRDHAIDHAKNIKECRQELLFVNPIVLTRARELAISAVMLAESSHFSGFLLNGAWSNAARIDYVSPRLAQYRRCSP